VRSGVTRTSAIDVGYTSAEKRNIRGNFLTNLENYFRKETTAVCFLLPYFCDGVYNSFSRQATVKSDGYADRQNFGRFKRRATAQNPRKQKMAHFSLLHNMVFVAHLDANSAQIGVLVRYLRY
jgi:hypothetical protein